MTKNLEVYVVGAVNLSLFSETGYSEPRCIVQIGNLRSSFSSQKKPVKFKKNRNPIIKKSVLFENIDNIKDTLKVEFWDFDDDNMKYVNIGEAIFPINKLQIGKGETFTLKLGEDSYTTFLLTLHEGKNEMRKSDDSKPKEKVNLPPPQPEPQPQPSQQNVQNQQKQHDKPQKPVLVFYKPHYIKRDQFPLAQGSYGTVYTGYVQGIKEKVVIKDMMIKDHKTIEEWKKEISVMNKTRCPYVVNIIGYSSQNNVLSIIMEYLSKGSLYDMIHKKKKKLSVLQKMRMARHCALGLEFLHSAGIMHRDVKSMNILIGDDYSCKFTDFGTAKIVSNQQKYHTINSGTPLWMAPEVRYTNKYDFSADIYSLGLVLYEIFESRLPHYNQHTNSVELPRSFKSSNIVRICVNPNPKHRPTASVVVTKINKMINNVLQRTRKILPPNVEELFKEELKKMGIENDEDKELLEFYKFLLNKNPDEVDALIDKAFGEFEKDKTEKSHVKQQMHQDYKIDVKPITFQYQHPVVQKYPQTLVPHQFQVPLYPPPQYGDPSLKYNPHKKM